MFKFTFLNFALLFSIHSVIAMEVDTKQKISFTEDLAEKAMPLLNNILDNDKTLSSENISSHEQGLIKKRSNLINTLIDAINNSPFSVFDALVSINSDHFPKQVCKHKNYKEKDNELMSALLTLYAEIMPLKELSKSYAKKTTTALEQLHNDLHYNPTLDYAFSDNFQQWLHHISNPTNTFLILADFRASYIKVPSQACKKLETFYDEIIETHQKNNVRKQEAELNQSDYLLSLGCNTLAAIVEKNRSSKANQ